jgi:hypothetical protein
VGSKGTLVGVFYFFLWFVFFIKTKYHFYIFQTYRCVSLLVFRPSPGVSAWKGAGAGLWGWELGLYRFSWDWGFLSSQATSYEGAPGQMEWGGGEEWLWCGPAEVSLQSLAQKLIKELVEGYRSPFQDGDSGG